MPSAHHKPERAPRQAPVLTAAEEQALHACPSLLDAEWLRACAEIPVDLETSARQNKALERKREIRSARDLLRLIFAYSLCDWSLRLVGAWATILGFACVSDVDLLQRFRKAWPWLQTLVGTWLALQRLQSCGAPAAPLAITVCDGSSVSPPGSSGTARAPTGVCICASICNAPA